MSLWEGYKGSLAALPDSGHQMLVCPEPFPGQMGPIIDAKDAKFVVRSFDLPQAGHRQSVLLGSTEVLIWSVSTGCPHLTQKLALSFRSCPQNGYCFIVSSSIEQIM